MCCYLLQNNTNSLTKNYFCSNKIIAKGLFCNLKQKREIKIIKKKVLASRVGLGPTPLAKPTLAFSFSSVRRQRRARTWPAWPWPPPPAPFFPLKILHPAASYPNSSSPSPSPSISPGIAGLHLGDHGSDMAAAMSSMSSTHASQRPCSSTQETHPRHATGVPQRTPHLSHSPRARSAAEHRHRHR